MSGRRRVQRSVRVTVVAGLVVMSGLLVLVAVAVAASSGVSVAAVIAAVTGVSAARIMYAEVVQSRQDAGKARAEQAQAFGAVLTQNHAEHAAFTKVMTSLLDARSRTIAALEARTWLAEKRADRAEASADREAWRADDAQARLSALLDEVLAHPVATTEPDRPERRGDLPAVVDLLTWEERASAAGNHDEPSAGEVRRHA